MKSVLVILILFTSITSTLFYFSNWLFRCIIGLLSLLTIWWFIFSTSDVNDLEYKKNIKKRDIIKKRYNFNKISSKKYDVIIIGSGMSGLHSGVVLSRIGYKVLILEQHSVAGGGTHEFELINPTNKNKYTFDSGLHYAIPISENILHLVCGTSFIPVKWKKLGLNEKDNCYDWIVLGDLMTKKEDYFRIKHSEKHLNDLYNHKLFNKKQDIIDIKNILNHMNYAMKLFPFWCFQRLLPLSLQKMYRKYILNKLLNFQKYAGVTTKEMLNKLTDNNILKSLVCGLWLDTGSPPTQCSFMLSSSVFRGFPNQGGAYPQNGSSSLAESLVSIINTFGGDVLCRAEVDKILINYNDNNHDCKPNINGLLLKNGDKIFSNNIISSIGYNNTFTKLFTSSDKLKLNIIPKIPNLNNSYSFILCNIGLNGNYTDLDIHDTNLWYQPINSDNNYSIFECIDDFLNCDDPQNDIFNKNNKNIDFCVGITWPSIKSKSCNLSSSTTTSCQMLILCPWKWFNKWYNNGKFKSSDSKNINKKYEKFKKLWMDACIKKLIKFYPKCENKIDFIDLSTPLSLEYYLKSSFGGAVGLDNTPNRFCDDNILNLTDCNKNNIINGLWLTGQDFLICGIPICQVAGIITALRFAGLKKSIYFILKATRTLFRWSIKQ